MSPERLLRIKSWCILTVNIYNILLKLSVVVGKPIFLALKFKISPIFGGEWKSCGDLDSSIVYIEMLRFVYKDCPISRYIMQRFTIQQQCSIQCRLCHSLHAMNTWEEGKQLKLHWKLHWIIRIRLDSF